MLDKLKTSLSIAVSFGLCLSLFYAIGYYDYYKVDITTYLGLDDLMLIFFNKVALATYVIVLIVASVGAVFEGISDTLDKVEWLKIKPLGLFKIRALLEVLIVFLFLWLCSKSIFLNTYGGILFLFMVFVSFCVLTFEPFFKVSNWPNISMRRWAFALFLFALLFIATPFWSGYLIGVNTKGDPIKIEFSNEKILETTPTNDIRLIGKTKDYIFIFNKANEYCSSYKMTDIKSLTILKTISP